MIQFLNKNTKQKNFPERGGRREFRGGRGRGETSEYEQKLLDLARVTRVVAGGRRFRFRATVVIGNRKGKVGVGVKKGQDVSMAVEKAAANAKKHLISVSLTAGGTIPHVTEAKFSAAKVLLKPSAEGRGIVAGGAVRVVCDLAGIQNVSGKILGKTKNKLNNARATIAALRKLKRPRAVVHRLPVRKKQKQRKTQNEKRKTTT